MTGRLTLTLLALLSVCAACNQNNNPYATQASSADKVQFDIDGQSLTWNGSYYAGSQAYAYLGGNAQLTDTNAILPNSDTSYLWSFSVVNINSILDIYFYEGRALNPGTYSFVESPAGQGSILGGFLNLTLPNPLSQSNSWTIVAGDSVSITISQVTDGVASGTFSAKLENPGTNPLYITGGTFSGVIVTNTTPVVTPP